MFISNISSGRSQSSPTPIEKSKLFWHFSYVRVPWVIFCWPILCQTSWMSTLAVIFYLSPTLFPLWRHGGINSYFVAFIFCMSSYLFLAFFNNSNYLSFLPMWCPPITCLMFALTCLQSPRACHLSLLHRSIWPPKRSPDLIWIAIAIAIAIAAVWSINPWESCSVRIGRSWLLCTDVVVPWGRTWNNCEIGEWQIMILWIDLYARRYAQRGDSAGIPGLLFKIRPSTVIVRCMVQYGFLWSILYLYWRFVTGCWKVYQSLWLCCSTLYQSPKAFSNN